MPWRAGQERPGGARGNGLGAESCSATAGKETLTGGLRTSARERGEGATDWAKKKERAGEENWAAGREEEKEGWAGLG